jgi:hypothetical protein
LRSCVASNCFSNPCKFLYDFNGNIVVGSSPLRLSLQQSQAQLTGTMQLGLDSAFFKSEGPVTGTTDTAGQVGLSGTATQTDLTTGQAVKQQDVRWRTVLSTDGSSMSGELTTSEVSGTTCSLTMSYSVTATRR